MQGALMPQSVSYTTLRNLISRKVHNRAPRWYGHVERMVEEGLLNNEVVFSSQGGKR
jgi:hypothetical protein